LVLIGIFVKGIGQTTSSLVWRISVHLPQHRPCGTTRCVVSIQALYLMERPSLCIVRTTCCRSDISSCSFHSSTNTWTFASWKCT